MCVGGILTPMSLDVGKHNERQKPMQRSETISYFYGHVWSDLQVVGLVEQCVKTELKENLGQPRWIPSELLSGSKWQGWMRWMMRIV